MTIPGWEWWSVHALHVNGDFDVVGAYETEEEAREAAGRIDAWREGRDDLPMVVVVPSRITGELAGSQDSRQDR